MPTSSNTVEVESKEADVLLDTVPPKTSSSEAVSLLTETCVFNNEKTTLLSMWFHLDYEKSNSNSHSEIKDETTEEKSSVTNTEPQKVVIKDETTEEKSSVTNTGPQKVVIKVDKDAARRRSTIEHLIRCATKQHHDFVCLLTADMHTKRYQNDTCLLDLWLRNKQLGVTVEELLRDNIDDTATCVPATLLTTPFKGHASHQKITLFDMWLSNTVSSEYKPEKVALLLKNACKLPLHAFHLLMHKNNEGTCLFDNYCKKKVPEHLDSETVEALMQGAYERMNPEQKMHAFPNGPPVTMENTEQPEQTQQPRTQFIKYIPPTPPVQPPFLYRCGQWCLVGLTLISLLGTITSPVLLTTLLGMTLSAVWLNPLFIGLASTTAISGLGCLILGAVRRKYYGKQAPLPPPSQDGHSTPSLSINDNEEPDPDEQDWDDAPTGEWPELELDPDLEHTISPTDSPTGQKH